MKKILFIIISFTCLNISIAQEIKKKSELTYEEYKTQELQKYSDFEKKILDELNNYIQQEEDWNLITLSNKGNVKDVTLSNNINIKENENKKIVIVKNTIPSKKEIKPDFVKEKEETKILPTNKTFTHPLKNNDYKVSSKFGYRIHPVYKTKRFHGGVDIAAPKNTPVYSIKSGKVMSSGYVNGYGNYVVIQHSDGIKSAYAHLNLINVTKGESISKGSQIGVVGKTGTATGYHLHFELIEGNKKVNPSIIIL